MKAYAPFCAAIRRSCVSPLLPTRGTVFLAALATATPEKKSVVCIQHTASAASLHANWLGNQRKDLRVGHDADVASQNKNNITYTTYEWVVTNNVAAAPCFTTADFIVLDDVHALSMEQEIACDKLRLAALRARFVMLSAYPESDSFEAAGPFLPAGSDASKDIPRATLSGNPPSPALSYLPEQQSRDFVDMRGYGAWVIGVLRKQRRRTVVFVPADPLLGMLAQLIASEFPALRVYLLNADHDPSVVAQINATETENVVVLMRPYFGSRVHLASIDQVVCPAFDEVRLLDRVIGKDRLQNVQLSDDRMRFLSCHASSDGVASKVHLASKKTRWEKTVRPTSGALFLHTSCTEYLLLIAELEPYSNPFREAARRPTCMRLFPDGRQILWALKQLELLGLIHIDASRGAGITRKGKLVLACTRQTGLSMRTALFLLSAQREFDVVGNDGAAFIASIAVAATMAERGRSLLVLDVVTGYNDCLTDQQLSDHLALVSPCEITSNLDRGTEATPERTPHLNGDTWCGAHLLTLPDDGLSIRAGQWKSMVRDTGAHRVRKAVDACMRKQPWWELIGKQFTSPDYIAEASGVGWTAAYAFNLVFLSSLSAVTSARREKPIWALDLCSSRQVRISPRSVASFSDAVAYEKRMSQLDGA